MAAIPSAKVLRLLPKTAMNTNGWPAAMSQITMLAAKYVESYLH
jgi:hypothetical protein